jgi:putative sigma-54 modulation protein
MRTDIKGVHLDITQDIRTHIDRKLHKLEFASSMIMDLLFTLCREGSSFKIEVTINFRWGTSAHIGVEAFDILEGIDILFDKIDAKVTKEKDKIQQHQ